MGNRNADLWKRNDEYVCVGWAKAAISGRSDAGYCSEKALTDEMYQINYKAAQALTGCLSALVWQAVGAEC